MSLAATVTAVVSFLLGVILIVLGLAAVEAGKGGYGYGPLPFLKVPTDWWLIGIGAAITVAGAALAVAGLEVIA